MYRSQGAFNNICSLNFGEFLSQYPRKCATFKTLQARLITPLLK